MKTITITVFALSSILMSFTPNKPVPAFSGIENAIAKTASIKWIKEEINLGEIVQNKPVPVEFEFKNTGDVPVVISNVQTSCGCTSANFSKVPVLPGETSKITATYNAAAKGVFKKMLTVTTSVEETPKQLTIAGTVI